MSSEVIEDLDYDINFSTTTSPANINIRVNSNPGSYLPSEDCASLNNESKDLHWKVHSTEIGDNNFHQYSPSEVTEEVTHKIDALATTLLASMTNLSYDTYLPSEFSSSTSSFISFTSSFAVENSAIERSDDHSNLVLSFIGSNSSIFETEDLHTPDPLISDANVISTSYLFLWLASIVLLARMIFLHRTFD